MLRAVLLISTLIAAGCVDSPSYYFAPEAVNATRGGMATHVEKIPQEEPQGAVEIATMGIVAGERGDRALHVRMALDNHGDEDAWRVDVREQLVEVPGVGRSQPQFANAGFQAMPELEIPRRERRVIDLYYPVPPGVKDADDLVGFDFLWQVDTSKREVSGRTRIDRREIIEPSPTVYAGAWGPYWWYDPWYPRVHYRTIYVRPHVHVHRRWR
jgi:hypothetical protein